MKRFRAITLATLILSPLPLLAPACRVLAEPVSPEWAQSWQDDLRFLAWKLPRTHPDPFTEVSREDFERRLDDLIATAAERSHTELVVELARIVAALGDGHSRVTLPLPDDAGFFLGHSPTAAPTVPGLLFRPLPIRLQRLANGWFVRAVHRDHSRAAGARVIAIGDKTVEEAAALVAPAVHRDNAQQLELQLPDYLVLPEVLAASGVIPAAGGVDFALLLPGGETLDLRLEPSTDGSAAELVDALAVRGTVPPRFLRATDRNFWLEHLPEERAVYVQYNTVADSEEETIAAFADRLFTLIEREPIDKVIFDLRWNRGGDNTLNRPLLHGLIASSKLQRPGSLFAIIGPATFSAAMMFAIDLERHTPAIFVGAPSGSTPNHFGDSRKLRLPRTGLTVRLSTLYWQNSDPRDDRDAIDPHLPVATVSAEYLSGHDPALAAILRPGSPGPASFAGRWQGRVVYRHTFEMVLALETDRHGSWSGRIDVPDLGILGAELDDIAVGGDRGEELGFVLPTPDGSFRFTARREGNRLYGALALGSRELPFVLVADEGRR